MNNKILISENFESKPLDIVRRIKEILNEKGGAYSVPAFSKRVGMSDSTFYRCLNGDRYFKPSELERIAEGLNISVARLKREDTQKKYLQMYAQTKHKVNLPYALELALELAPIAIGCTERFEVLNCLGVIYLYMKKTKQAVHTWYEALEHAETLFVDYGEHEPLYMILNNLIFSQTMLKNYSTLSDLLAKAEAHFEQFPPRLAGTISYSQALTAYNRGDLEEYEEKMRQHLDMFEQTDEPRLIAIALQNVAYMLYVVGMYESAVSAFERAIAHMTSYEELSTSELRFTSQKDYAKTLFKLNQKDKALDVIQQAMQGAEAHNYPNAHAKLLLLRALISGTIEDADTALNKQDVAPEVRLLACKMLMDHASRSGDEKSLMRYYKIGDGLQASPKTKMEDSL